MTIGSLRVPEDHGSRLAVLPAEESLRLLASAQVARIAWVDGPRARVVPVTIAVDGDAVVFWTGPGRKLDAIRAGAPLTLAADGMEPALHVGWSVEVVGRAEIVTGAATLDRIAELGLAPWDPSRREHPVRLAIEEIQGRRLVPGPGRILRPEDSPRTP